MTSTSLRPGTASDHASVAGLAAELTAFYSAQFSRALLSQPGFDPSLIAECSRQFFLGNGGCWSVGFSVADNLRGKVARGKVASAWHPHEIAGAITADGFTSSFAQLLARDGIGEGDVVHLVSGSGRSTNLLAAVDVARASGAEVFAHCGHDGGRLRVAVPDGTQIKCSDQQVVEDVLLLRLWPGWAQDKSALAVLTASIAGALQAEVENLARAASALVRAIQHHHPVGVVALDVAVVSAAAEHVAHNLSWDMCWGLPDVHPDVRFALSNGLVTAVANDSGQDTAPFEHMLGEARTRGIVLRLDRRGHLKTRANIEIGIAPGTFNSLLTSCAELALSPEDKDYLCGVLVQSWGHLLMRLGRTLMKDQDSFANAAARSDTVRESIAPRLGRR